MTKLSDEEALKDLKWMLAHGMDVNAVNYENTATPLIFAIENFWTKCVRLLIKEGANINGSLEGYTPLTIAVSRGNIWDLKVLIKAGADLESTGNHGQTVLHTAASCGRPNLFKILLDAGSKKDAQEGFGKTALHIAVNYGSVEKTKYLIKAGADIEIQDKSGERPLQTAVLSDWSILEDKYTCIKLMLDAGADVNAKDFYNNTALTLAIKNKYEVCVNMLRARIAKLEKEALESISLTTATLITERL